MMSQGFDEQENFQSNIGQESSGWIGLLDAATWQ